MREILKLMIVLAIFCAVSGFSLSFVKEATKDRIEYNKIKLLVAPAIKAVFPSYDNDPVLERKKVKISEEKIVTVFPAKKGGKLIGIGYVEKGSGHGGPVEVMLGINVVKHNETPGIGTLAVESKEFLSQFKGKTLESDIEAEVQAVSGATETSNAIKEGVRKGVELFPRIKDKIG